jgi:hypothetical protein
LSLQGRILGFATPKIQDFKQALIEYQPLPRQKAATPLLAYRGVKQHFLRQNAYIILKFFYRDRPGTHAGSLMGLIIAYWNVPPFIATLGQC